MIQVIVHSSPNGPVSETRLDDLGKLITHEQTTIWVDVVDPTLDEIARIGEEFHFHPLALEDVARGGQRPKVDQYDGYQFIVFYGLASQNERITTHEVDIFLAKHCMVTFHKSDLPVMTQTAERWRNNAAVLGNHGVGFLLHSVLDALVDGYFPVLDDIAERADTLEESIILAGQPMLQAEILRLRRELLMIRRVAGPERDVMNVLIRRDPPLFNRTEILYFQDVYDHLLRVADTVDIYRDMLSSVLDANLSMVSYTLNIGGETPDLQFDYPYVNINRRGNLRNELRIHAGARLAIGLPLRARTDGSRSLGRDRHFPPDWLAATGC